MKDSIKEVNSIFEQPWWLDAVVPGQWECIQVTNGDEIEARWPLLHSRKAMCSLYGMPRLTQTLGPWIRPRNGKRVKVYSYIKKTVASLAAQLPKKANIDICIDSNLEFILPFRLLGFKYEPHYSYRFSDLSDPDAIFKGMGDTRKTDIRNAGQRLTVRDDAPIETIIDLQAKTFRRQNRKCPTPESLIRRIDEACLDHNARFLLTAEDSEGHIHAASYFVYDENRCYYLMSGIDPEYKNSGANSLLLWEGIKRAASVSKSFDFEGSEIEDIEQFFRSYGAECICYHRLYRINALLSFLNYIKPAVKRIIGYK